MYSAAYDGLSVYELGALAFRLLHRDYENGYFDAVADGPESAFVDLLANRICSSDVPFCSAWASPRLARVSAKVLVNTAQSWWSLSNPTTTSTTNINTTTTTTTTMTTGRRNSNTTLGGGVGSRRVSLSGTLAPMPATTTSVSGNDNENPNNNKSTGTSRAITPVSTSKIAGEKNRVSVSPVPPTLQAAIEKRRVSSNNNKNNSTSNNNDQFAGIPIVTMSTTNEDDLNTSQVTIDFASYPASQAQSLTTHPTGQTRGGGLLSPQDNERRRRERRLSTIGGASAFFGASKEASFMKRHEELIRQSSQTDYESIEKQIKQEEQQQSASTTTLPLSSPSEMNTSAGKSITDLPLLKFETDTNNKTDQPPISVTIPEGSTASSNQVGFVATGTTPPLISPTLPPVPPAPPTVNHVEILFRWLAACPELVVASTRRSTPRWWQPVAKPGDHTLKLSDTITLAGCTRLGGDILLKGGISVTINDTILSEKVNFAADEVLKTVPGVSHNPFLPGSQGKQVRMMLFVREKKSLEALVVTVDQPVPLPKVLMSTRTIPIGPSSIFSTATSTTTRMNGKFWAPLDDPEKDFSIVDMDHRLVRFAEIRAMSDFAGYEQCVNENTLPTSVMNSQNHNNSNNNKSSVLENRQAIMANSKLTPAVDSNIHTARAFESHFIAIVTSDSRVVVARIRPSQVLVLPPPEKVNSYGGHHSSSSSSQQQQQQPKHHHTIGSHHATDNLPFLATCCQASVLSPWTCVKIFVCGAYLVVLGGNQLGDIEWFAVREAGNSLVPSGVIRGHGGAVRTIMKTPPSLSQPWFWSCGVSDHTIVLYSLTASYHIGNKQQNSNDNTKSNKQQQQKPTVTEIRRLRFDPNIGAPFKMKYDTRTGYMLALWPDSCRVMLPSLPFDCDVVELVDDEDDHDQDNNNNDDNNTKSYKSTTRKQRNHNHTNNNNKRFQHLLADVCTDFGLSAPTAATVDVKGNLKIFDLRTFKKIQSLLPIHGSSPQHLSLSTFESIMPFASLALGIAADHSGGIFCAEEVIPVGQRPTFHSGAPAKFLNVIAVIATDDTNNTTHSNNLRRTSGSGGGSNSQQGNSKSLIQGLMNNNMNFQGSGSLLSITNAANVRSLAARMLSSLKRQAQVCKTFVVATTGTEVQLFAVDSGRAVKQFKWRIPLARKQKKMITIEKEVEYEDDIDSNVSAFYSSISGGASPSAGSFRLRSNNNNQQQSRSPFSIASNQASPTFKGRGLHNIHSSPNNNNSKKLTSESRARRRRTVVNVSTPQQNKALYADFDNTTSKNTSKEDQVIEKQQQQQQQYQFDASFWDKGNFLQSENAYFAQSMMNNMMSRSAIGLGPTASPQSPLSPQIATGAASPSPFSPLNNTNTNLKRETLLIDKEVTIPKEYVFQIIEDTQREGAFVVIAADPPPLSYYKWLERKEEEEKKKKKEAAEKAAQLLAQAEQEDRNNNQINDDDDDNQQQQQPTREKSGGGDAPDSGFFANSISGSLPGSSVLDSQSIPPPSLEKEETFAPHPPSSSPPPCSNIITQNRVAAAAASSSPPKKSKPVISFMDDSIIEAENNNRNTLEEFISSKTQHPGTMLDGANSLLHRHNNNNNNTSNDSNIDPLTNEPRMPKNRIVFFAPDFEYLHTEHEKRVRSKMMLSDENNSSSSATMNISSGSLNDSHDNEHGKNTSLFIEREVVIDVPFPVTSSMIDVTNPEEATTGNNKNDTKQQQQQYQEDRGYRMVGACACYIAPNTETTTTTDVVKNENINNQHQTPLPPSIAAVVTSTTSATTTSSSGVATCFVKETDSPFLSIVMFEHEVITSKISTITHYTHPQHQNQTTSGRNTPAATPRTSSFSNQPNHHPHHHGSSSTTTTKTETKSSPLKTLTCNIYLSSFRSRNVKLVMKGGSCSGSSNNSHNNHNNNHHQSEYHNYNQHGTSIIVVSDMGEIAVIDPQVALKGDETIAASYYSFRNAPTATATSFSSAAAAAVNSNGNKSNNNVKSSSAVAAGTQTFEHRAPIAILGTVPLLLCTTEGAVVDGGVGSSDLFPRRYDQDVDDSSDEDENAAVVGGGENGENSNGITEDDLLNATASMMMMTSPQGNSMMKSVMMNRSLADRMSSFRQKSRALGRIFASSLSPSKSTINNSNRVGSSSSPFRRSKSNDNTNSNINQIDDDDDSIPSRAEIIKNNNTLVIYRPVIVGIGEPKIVAKTKTASGLVPIQLHFGEEQRRIVSVEVSPPSEEIMKYVRKMKNSCSINKDKCMLGKPSKKLLQDNNDDTFSATMMVTAENNNNNNNNNKSMMMASNIFGKSTMMMNNNEDTNNNNNNTANNNNLRKSKAKAEAVERKKMEKKMSETTTDVFIAIYSWIPSASGHEIVPLSFFKPFDSFALGGGISSFKFVSAWDAVMIARSDRPEVCVHAVPSGTYLGSLDAFTVDHAAATNSEWQVEVHRRRVAHESKQQREHEQMNADRDHNKNARKREADSAVSRTVSFANNKNDNTSSSSLHNNNNNNSNASSASGNTNRYPHHENKLAALNFSTVSRRKLASSSSKSDSSSIHHQKQIIDPTTGAPSSVTATRHCVKLLEPTGGRTVGGGIERAQLLDNFNPLIKKTVEENDERKKKQRELEHQEKKDRLAFLEQLKAGLLSSDDMFKKQINNTRSGDKTVMFEDDREVTDIEAVLEQVAATTAFLAARHAVGGSSRSEGGGNGNTTRRQTGSGSGQSSSSTTAGAKLSQFLTGNKKNPVHHLQHPIYLSNSSPERLTASDPRPTTDPNYLLKAAARQSTTANIPGNVLQSVLFGGNSSGAGGGQRGNNNDDENENDGAKLLPTTTMIPTVNEEESSSDHNDNKKKQKNVYLTRSHYLEWIANEQEMKKKKREQQEQQQQKEQQQHEQPLLQSRSSSIRVMNKQTNPPHLQRATESFIINRNHPKLQPGVVYNGTAQALTPRQKLVFSVDQLKTIGPQKTPKLPDLGGGVGSSSSSSNNNINNQDEKLRQAYENYLTSNSSTSNDHSQQQFSTTGGGGGGGLFGECSSLEYAGDQSTMFVAKKAVVEVGKHAHTARPTRTSTTTTTTSSNVLLPPIHRRR